MLTTLDLGSSSKWSAKRSNFEMPARVSVLSPAMLLLVLLVLVLLVLGRGKVVKQQQHHLYLWFCLYVYGSV